MSSRSLQRIGEPMPVRSSHSNTNDMTERTAIGLGEEAIGLGQEQPWRRYQSFVTAWSLSLLLMRSSLVHR